MDAALARVSVVVPVGPGDRLSPRLRAQLAALPAGAEVLVVCADGEPLETRHAEESGDCGDCGPLLRWLSAPRGRASQQNTGASCATRDWLWLLHADSVMTTGTLPSLARFVQRNEQALGFFDLRFLDDGPALMRLNALGVWFRSRGLGLPFGDQGLVLPRAAFQRLGGFDTTVAWGEDHELVWRARRAGLPPRAVRGTLCTSARKYAQDGWWRTTCRHLLGTWQQARRFSRTPLTAPDPAASAMSGAVAIFVKTPGRSVVKSRLATDCGVVLATSWYRRAADAVGSVARLARARHGMAAYWAVAEPDARADWPDLPMIFQGEGGLGARMAAVHAQLVQRHGFGILIGADAPQLTTCLLQEASEWLASESPRLVIGPAHDGGFWLFGANRAVPLTSWEAVTYSAADTAGQFRRALHDLGEWRTLQTLSDGDHRHDMPSVLSALQSLPDPTPEQRKLGAWMRAQAQHLS